VTPSYDQARQFGKTYVAALNTGAEAFASLFAPGASVRVGGRPSDPEGVRAATPPGRSGFRGARLEPPEVVLTVRVIDQAAESVDDRVHRLRFDDAGRVASLEA
jgi:hypothetical protein